MNRIIFLFLIVIVSCDTNQSLTIKPISEIFNDEAEFGVQYYEIDNYRGCSDSILMQKIIDFSEMELFKKDLLPPKIESQFFYKKTMFNSCSDIRNIRESARETETQTLLGCDDELIAKLYMYEIDGVDSNINKKEPYIRRKVLIYNNEYSNNYSKRIDTLQINGNHWNLIHRGEITHDEY